MPKYLTIGYGDREGYERVSPETLGEKRQAKEDEKRDGAAAHPVVRKVMELFPGAKIVAVRAPEVQQPEAPPPTDEDVGYAEPPDFDED